MSDVYYGTIQAQNKILTIWLLHKVYCRLLSAFVYILQPTEDNVGKTLGLFHCKTTEYKQFSYQAPP